MATKKTTRTAEAAEQDDLITASPDVEAEVISRPLTSANGSSYMYFTERDLNKILHNLDTLRTNVYPYLVNQQDADTQKQPQFPAQYMYRFLPGSVWLPYWPNQTNPSEFPHPVLHQH